MGGKIPIIEYLILAQGRFDLPLGRVGQVIHADAALENGSLEDLQHSEHWFHC